ncbi:MAG: alpha/beta hydrolase [Parahaliea sp.]
MLTDSDAALSVLYQGRFQQYLDFYHIDFSRRFTGLAHHCGRLACGDFRLVAHYWQQPGAIRNLLLLHGYFDHAGLFRHLIEYGLSRGCNVIAYDLPGHGLSSGQAAAIDSFDYYGDSIETVITALKQTHLPDLPVWVMGQSTGCAALINFASRYAWPFSDAVLLAPLLRPVQWQQVRTAHLLLQPFLKSVPRRFAVNSSDPDFIDFLQLDPLQPKRIPVCWVGALRRWLAALAIDDLGVGPALIVQGDADGTVDWRFNLPRIGQLFPGSRIELVPDAGHHLANESVALRARYLRAIDRYMGLG